MVCAVWPGVVGKRGKKARCFRVQCSRLQQSREQQAPRAVEGLVWFGRQTAVCRQPPCMPLWKPFLSPSRSLTPSPFIMAASLQHDTDGNLDQNENTSIINGKKHEEEGGKRLFLSC
jgi:hypothetical protein